MASTNTQARVDGTPGIVFMGRGVAEIDQPITEVLGDIACVVLDDLGTASWQARTTARSLPGRAGRRAAWSPGPEQHGELPPFRFSGNMREAPGSQMVRYAGRLWSRPLAESSGCEMTYRSQ